MPDVQGPTADQEVLSILREAGCLFPEATAARVVRLVRERQTAAWKSTMDGWVLRTREANAAQREAEDQRDALARVLDLLAEELPEVRKWLEARAGEAVSDEVSVQGGIHVTGRDEGGCGCGGH